MPVNVGSFWTSISLNQFSQRIKKLVLVRPPVSDTARGHIYIDNFQFSPVTTVSPIGYLDGVDIQQAAAFGWSRDPDNPSASNNVDCYVDGAFIGRVLANLFSSNVPPLGNHRFSLSIPMQYRDGNPHQINCYGLDVTGGDPPTLLTGSPKTFKFNTPIGNFDSVSSDGDATGWSLDPDVPRQSNTVHFYIGGPAGAVPIAGIVTADIERPDVNKVTNYPGNHGFSFSIPAQYRDGNPHPIYAYGIDLTGDLNKPLGGNPKTFTLSPLVKNVSFQQIATDDLPIDANPNTSGGLRIFPDDKNPNDQTDRRIIRVKAQSSVRMAGIRIYFRNYDLNDPSSDVEIDPNGNVGNDNNGSLNIEGTLTFAGLLKIPIGPEGEGCQTFSAFPSGGVSCLTNSDGIAIVDYIVTRQPGDNFTVAASTDENYIGGISGDGINLRDSSNTQIPATTTIVNACENSSVKACRTDMLTVWRRLHIEVDSMGTSQQNFILGTIPDGITKLRRFEEVTLIVNPSPANQLEVNRFENGRVTFNANSQSLQIASNTADSITVTNTGVAMVSIPAGSSFQLFDDDDFNDDDGPPPGDGTLDGDTETDEDIPEPPDSLLQPNDILCSQTVTTNCNVFASSYIRPMQYTASDSRDNSIFQGNIESDNVIPDPVRDVFRVDFDQVATEADPEFWTIYLYGSYQQNLNSDADPDDEDRDGTPHGCGDASYGVVDDFAPNGWGAAIHMEVGRPREYPSNYAGRPVSRAWTAAHEVGHLFGGDHEDGGIMTPSCQRTGYEFAPLTIRRLRNAIRHP